MLNMSLFRRPLSLLLLFLELSALRFDAEFGSGKDDYGNKTEGKGHKVVSGAGSG